MPLPAHKITWEGAWSGLLGWELRFPLSAETLCLREFGWCHPLLELVSYFRRKGIPPAGSEKVTVKPAASRRRVPF